MLVILTLDILMLVILMLDVDILVTSLTDTGGSSVTVDMMLDGNIPMRCMLCLWPSWRT